MTDGHDSAEKPALPSPRPAKRRLTFVLLAGVLALVGALAAGYYFAMRPVTLRIAVGPANSDDLKVVQNLTQAFNNQKGSLVRLRP
ncbi:MAG: TRAP transporter substrate-binding protein, partial [Bradyrhizobium sp.]|nr:TRAP transporter substrate-binding protein [Bradyrhizobium sp.]